MKLRPWLQDFNLGATYNAPMIRAQIKATYDSGLTSWLLWDPKVIYTKGGLLAAGEDEQESVGIKTPVASSTATSTSEAGARVR